MKYLTQMVFGPIAAVGIAACVNSNPVETACAAYEPKPFSVDYVELPQSVKPEGINWDRAYFEAFIGDTEIHLNHLRLESDCKDKAGVKAIRLLTDQELRNLGVRTREALAAYLKSKAKETDGYITSPNIMF